MTNDGLRCIEPAVFVCVEIRAMSIINIDNQLS
jgi:hypothetical protein